MLKFPVSWDVVSKTGNYRRFKDPNVSIFRDQHPWD